MRNAFICLFIFGIALIISCSKEQTPMEDEKKDNPLFTGLPWRTLYEFGDWYCAAPVANCVPKDVIITSGNNHQNFINLVGATPSAVSNYFNDVGEDWKNTVPEFEGTSILTALQDAECVITKSEPGGVTNFYFVRETGDMNNYIAVVPIK